MDMIKVRGASEHNLKDLNVDLDRNQITVITGVSGSGKSSLAFDTILREAQRRFFYTLSHYSRQFLDLGSRPKVRSITGLSPAVGLSQNETMPSRRASVGTLTDVSELLGVAFGLYGDRTCPVHGYATSPRGIQEIVAWIAAEFIDKTVMIVAPIAEKKKGSFKQIVTKMERKGYRAIVNGLLCGAEDFPELAKERKHTIVLVIDQLKIKGQPMPRLQRAIETACEEGEGIGQVILVDKSGGGSEHVREFSTQAGCKECGFSWPKLDSRHFSANSLGACTRCQGYGEIGNEDAEEDDSIVTGRLDVAERCCPDCAGTGVDKKYAAVKLHGYSLHELAVKPIAELRAIFVNIRAARAQGSKALLRLIDEILSQLQRVVEVGLGYLPLMRRVRTLSTGEAQRLRLAGVLGESMRSVLYILDEPSQGLHAAEIDLIFTCLKKLKELGNTVILVDHDETIMRKADWIVDLGPQGGSGGGKLMAKFKPEDAEHYASLSKTAEYLGRKPVTKPRKVSSGTLPKTASIEIIAPCLNNLKIDQINIPLAAMSVVSGVSGAGKGSLILGVLYENLQNMLSGSTQPPRFCKAIGGHEAITQVWLVDRKPISRSGVSMPITYLDLFTDIRNLYATVPEAQIAGLSAADFSLSRAGGRCEECKGNGQIELSMRFLVDAKVICPVCKGDRYNPAIKNVRYGGFNLTEVLAMTIDEAYEHFQNHKKIHRKLKEACELGLGYLKLGQPTVSLSGGEAQRLKLLPFFAKNAGPTTMLILNEPTAGLHFEDVERLLVKLRQVVDQGTTVILIENNEDVIAAADWLVFLGPGSAQEGGKVIFQGVPRKDRARR